MNPGARFAAALSGAAIALASTPASAQLPDLRVTKADYVGTPKEGLCNTVRITVYNDSTTPVTADIPLSHLMVEAGEGAVTRKDGTMFGGIGTRMYKTMELAGVPLIAWPGTFSVVVDPNNAIPESAENNNVLQVSPALAGFCSKLGVADAKATAGDPMSFSVSLSPEHPYAPVSVQYTVGGGFGQLKGAVGGPACGKGVDFIASSGTLNFAKGEKNKSIRVTTCRGERRAGDRTFAVTLSNATRAEMARASATGTISD